MSRKMWMIWADGEPVSNVMYRYPTNRELVDIYENAVHADGGRLCSFPEVSFEGYEK